MQIIKNSKIYIVKFFARDGSVYSITPPMTMEEAQKISRDLQLTDLTAWVEDKHGVKVENE